MDQERAIAVGLLTRRDLDVLGPTFRRVWPIHDTPCFIGLLKAIDEADQEYQQCSCPETGELTEKPAHGSEPG